MKFIKSILSGVTGRLIRSILSLGIGILISRYKDNAWYMAATPLIQAIGKAVRDKWPEQFDWLPL